MSGAARVYDIPAAAGFLDALARGLLARFPDPVTLAQATVLLPTRRACRELRHAFLRASEGRALLLPRLQPLGDVETEDLAFQDEVAGPWTELPPPGPPLVRLLLLARLVARRFGEAAPRARDLALAAELARLLDQVETEGLDFDGLDRLVPEELSRHWQEVLDFLAILTRTWPEIERESGAIGLAAHRRRLHELLAESWRREAPPGPLIAAGSTGSVPTTGLLLSVVARLPQGMVVLPGLDRAAGETVWQAIGRDPLHPQHGLALLLRRLEVDRDQVLPWPGTEPAAREGESRRRLIATALLPTARTADWARPAGRLTALEAGAGLQGVRRIDCADAGEEAVVVALLLREALEMPERTAALVTPDRHLGRRVAAELRRWDVEVDDSAGLSLGLTEVGTFLRLVVRLAAEDLAPVAFLAALKHPLAAAGQDSADFRTAVRRLELAVLHGPRPEPGVAGLRAALGAGAPGHLLRLIDRLEAVFAPLLALLRQEAASLDSLLEVTAAAAEALAATRDESGPLRLWSGEDGEAAAAFFADARQAAGQLPTPVATAEFPGILDRLLEGVTVRPLWGRHPRIAILGPLEARLLRFDLLVLGGLNEGVWPAESDAGPWLSRPMRMAFGLPPLERRIGLASHDFAQALGAPQVVLTRARKVQGAPAVPSRWLQRLDAVVEAAGLDPMLLRRDEELWRRLARGLDAPAAVRPAAPPAPRPPLRARPRRLSVTDIEAWMRDPYEIYAKRILRLRRLKPLDEDFAAAARGTFVHAWLEAFLQAWPDRLPADPAAMLMAEAEPLMAAFRLRPGVRALWRPRLARIADWVAEQEGLRRHPGLRIFVEREGGTQVGRDFLVTAKADRIERRPDGSLVLLDYKTGKPPGPKAVESGWSAQLPLEALIAAAGGFAGVPAGPVEALVYWRLSGRATPGEESSPAADRAAVESLAQAARAGVEALVEAFDDPQTAYHPRPRPLPSGIGRYSDYLHLARLQEWSNEEAP